MDIARQMSIIYWVTSNQLFQYHYLLQQVMKHMFSQIHEIPNKFRWCNSYYDSHIFTKDCRFWCVSFSRPEQFAFIISFR